MLGLSGVITCNADRNAGPRLAWKEGNSMARALNKLTRRDIDNAPDGWLGDGGEPRARTCSFNSSKLLAALLLASFRFSFRSLFRSSHMISRIIVSRREYITTASAIASLQEFLTYKDEVTAELFDELRFERFMTKVTHLCDMLFKFRQMLPLPK